MSVISSITLPNRNTYGFKNTVLSVKGTQTSDTASWTGAIELDALYDGLTIAYYLPRTSASNVTLNLTLSDGTSTTGAVPVYLTGTTRMGTHYAAGSTILLTYWSSGSISVGGTATTENRWTHADYYISNTDTKVRQSLASDNTDRPLLLAYSNNSTTTANVDNVSYRNNSIYANPSTGTVTATNFSGKINGYTIAKDLPSTAKLTDTTYTANTRTVGSASTGTALSASRITAFSGGSVPTLGTALSASRITAFSGGSAPTLGTALSASKITAYTAGSPPTLGTALSASKITAFSGGTAATASVVSGVLTLTNGAVASIGYTTTSIPNVTNKGTATSIGYTTTSIPNVTNAGSAASIGYTTTTIPNVTNAGSAASIGYTTTTIPNISVSNVTVVSGITAS